MSQTSPESRRALLWSSLLLIAAGVALVVARLDGMSTQEFMAEHVSLDPLPYEIDDQIAGLLIVPLGAVVVVLFRLTLGVTMLGPFRPILIALALEHTGVVAGTLFTAAVMAAVALVRPRLRNVSLPYFSRLMVLLTCVVMLQVAVVLVGDSADWESFARVAFFPIVVLCLTADGFARVLARDGMRVAVWRGASTLGIAVAIDGLFAIPGVRELVFAYPELMLVELALLLLISGFLNLRLFEHVWNRGADKPPAL